MPLSNKQKMLCHTAAKAAGIPESMRREVQRKVGGFWSAKDRTASREGFIALMAFYEARAGGHLGGFTPGYWQGEDREANPGDSMRRRIRSEADALGLSPAKLDGFIAGPHMSNGLFAGLDEAQPYWLRKILEGLKAIRTRRERRPA